MDKYTNTKEHLRILRYLSEHLDWLLNKAVSVGFKDANIEDELKELKDMLEFYNKTVESDKPGTDEADKG